jgi:hypothetical protein
VSAPLRRRTDESGRASWHEALLEAAAYPKIATRPTRAPRWISCNFPSAVVGSAFGAPLSLSPTRHSFLGQQPHSLCLRRPRVCSARLTTLGWRACAASGSKFLTATTVTMRGRPMHALCQHIPYAMCCLSCSGMLLASPRTGRPRRCSTRATLAVWTANGMRRAFAALRGALRVLGFLRRPVPPLSLVTIPFVVCGRHLLGLGGPTCVSPRPCLCGAGNAATPDHAMLCKSVVKMNRMRHDIVASAVRRVVCRASCVSSMKPSYLHLRNHAVASQRRGDNMVVLPSDRICIVDVVVTHPSQQKFAARACVHAGHAAAKWEQGKVDKFRELGEDAAQYDFVPFGVETYGCLGASAQSFLKQLGDVAASRAAISKAAFVRSAYREVSCALQRG